MSVDTYLKGKNTSRYQRIHDQDEVTVIVAPSLVGYAHKIELIARKKLVGSKLVAVAYHEHSASCRH
ncbi:MAG: hypothetical protein GY724_17760 [Actinomycetia bacterium]|nr:hypothetical protein [Actinomycetes bacterium]MCP4226910.1 hypothetical protein [Actinomycetes bacterium]MCP5031314.1 hypothetical protein [Actinomycetes bacterium]